MLTFLVDDWVSSLKRTGERMTVKTKIGFEHASYRWNTGDVTGSSATDKSKPADKKDKKTKPESNGSKVPAIRVEAPGSPSTSTSGSAVDRDSADAAPQYFKLSDLHVDFPIGKLTVITGPTGSGKSAILTALLGEMELLEGKGHLPKFPAEVDSKTGLKNSVAYCSQTAWLQQMSIKDNILFGEEYNEKRYNDTIEACALYVTSVRLRFVLMGLSIPDFDMLEDGDSTEIGQKGVSHPRVR